MNGGVQLPLATGVAELPFNPHDLAQLTTPERGRLYGELELDHFQREAAEEAVRLVIRREYGRRSR